MSRTQAEIIVALGEDISEDDLPELDIDELHSAGILQDDGPLLRAGTHGDWSFVIEPEGPYLANDEVLKTVSHDTEAFPTWLRSTSVG
ncbi:hypothetical protein [Streptomyces sp. NPDC058476]|uniref:hypothetical protein n=1 Tax=Streptomyces sp. NPDC058476 TaxID=3346519 RepID=UPI00365C24EF